MVSWPKLAANTNVSPLAPVAAGAADAVCVVAPAWVPLVAESAAVGWWLVATGLARPVSAVAVAVGWLLVDAVGSSVAASVVLASWPEAADVESPAGVLP